jgi:hypothetical protein
LAENIMQKTLTLFLLGFGLVLIPVGAAFAKADYLHVYFGPTTRLFNVNSSRTVSAGYTDRAASGAYSLVAASHSAQDGYATATLNMSGATLAGALTLLLLQRRHRDDNILRPRN